jgi:hypothetical protein
MYLLKRYNSRVYCSLQPQYHIPPKRCQCKYLCIRHRRRENKPDGFYFLFSHILHHLDVNGRLTLPVRSSVEKKCFRTWTQGVNHVNLTQVWHLRNVSTIQGMKLFTGVINSVVQKTLCMVFINWNSEV